MNPINDTDRIYDLLLDIRDQLAQFRLETEKRLAALEERNSVAKTERMEARLSEIEAFKAKAGVYMAIAAASASALVGVVLHLLKVA